MNQAIDKSCPVSLPLHLFQWGELRLLVQSLRYICKYKYCCTINIKGHTELAENVATLCIEGRLAKHIPYYESQIYKWPGFLRNITVQESHVQRTLQVKPSMCVLPTSNGGNVIFLCKHDDSCRTNRKRQKHVMAFKNLALWWLSHPFK